MRKYKTPHRHQIRGLFLTLSATVLASSLSSQSAFAQFSVATIPEASSPNMTAPTNGELDLQNPESEFYHSQQSGRELAGKEDNSLQNSDPSGNRSFASSTQQTTSIYPLGWEAHVAQGFQWSDFALKTINLYGTHLSNGAKDVTSFCPNYNKLGQEQKINFWGQLISAMAQFESGFKPTSHFREGTMGTDPITKQHVYSDGLLQLSYQDVTQYHFCDEFNWAHDRQFSELDPRKTIFDPYLNLRCGIRILNAEVARTGLISYRKGQYWSVLWPAHVAKIKSVTRKIPYCSTN